MVRLWRCEICGDPYIGEAPPENCPFCGAHRRHLKDAREARADFDLDISAIDRANAEHALRLEAGNSSFYFCAAGKTDSPEGRLLFKALGKIEAEHAGIWRKVLRLESAPAADEPCHAATHKNIEESHARETRAVDFYRRAASVSEHPRIRQIFEALVEIETDHLHLSGARLGQKGEGWARQQEAPPKDRSTRT
jgi:rubrerythrin/rubredoxin